MPAPRHVLIVRTDHLGDMLLTLPAASALKAAYPQCRISVLASRANAVAAQHHPEIDHVEVDAFEAKGSGLRGIWTLVGQLRALDCDAAVVVHATPRLALAVWLARIPIRVGTAYRAYSFLFNRRVHQHRRESTQHETQLNVELLGPLGVKAATVTPVRWRVDEEEAMAIERLLRERGVDGGDFVVLHPGNAGSAMNWAPPQYAELGRRLQAHGVRIVVTGGPDERPLSAQVAADIGNRAIDLGGATNLPQLCALLQRARLYVGSATGPTHLAAAVGTPVVALYSPLRSSVPSRWRPLGDNVQVLQPALDIHCPKCLREQCPHWHCMQRYLSVDVVEAMALRVMRSPTVH